MPKSRQSSSHPTSSSKNHTSSHPQINNQGHTHPQHKHSEEPSNRSNASASQSSFFQQFGFGYITGIFMGWRSHHRRHEIAHDNQPQNEINRCAFFARSLLKDDNPGIQLTTNYEQAQAREQTNKDGPEKDKLIAHVKYTKYCHGLLQSLSEINKANMSKEIQALEQERTRTEKFDSETFDASSTSQNKI